MFNQPPGSDEICEICSWEDDLSQLRFPKTEGANKVSLIEAQKNFEKFGAFKKHAIKYVRKPEKSDEKDQEWRMINVLSDNIEKPVPSFDYGKTYPENVTKFYYWTKNFWRRKIDK